MLMNMKEILDVANEHNFAVPAFNIGSGIFLNAIIKKCEELKAPVILAVHPDELEFQGDAFITMCREVANKTKVPCCIHLDHGADLGQVLRAIRTGYTSVMIDASHYSLEENIAITKKVVEVAHPLGVSVESELGTIGDAGSMEKSAKEIIFTDPKIAKKLIDETGIDCLAIAIGTAHGIYPEGFVPHLQLDLLTEIKNLVKIPLVLHGGSSNDDAEIAESVRRGVNKINISSDFKDAFFQAARVTLANDKKAREPFAIFGDAIKAMDEVVEHKIKLFNDDDKCKYFSL